MHEGFIRYIEDDIAQHGFKLKEYNSMIKLGRSKVNGYLDDTKKELAFARIDDVESWLSVLVHEYSHFRQHINGKFNNGNNYFDIVDQWINKKKEYSDKTLDRAFRFVRNCELDCERGALKIIDEFGLSIDKKLYIQKAAAYVYLYFYARKHRRWHGKRAHYRYKTIYSLMPTTLRGRFNTIPDEIMEIFEKKLGVE